MTAVNTVPKSQRALLSYSVEGLPHREEVLLKSLIRLLDHRTHQNWSWKAEQADLRVVGDQVALAAASPQPAVPTLTVAHADPQRGPFLALPLHTDALEVVLNRLGAMVVHARGLGLATTEVPIGEHEEFRMLRWPPAAVLEAPIRLRLATLMSNRPASVLSLQQRSPATRQECADFLADLHRAGLLERAAPPGALVAASAPDSVFPDSRFPAPARDTVQPGLLARIRNRLGLLPSGPQ
ncbi:hypothetical protein [Variovorax boronicumulans]|uniref:hypothetical protein n=1 Tax=Variovorax boronicumulans TaxID=436515 RepID=UPI0012E4D0DE|nr:hypothetical protein [Variovorax boronicumulans]GER15109.1 hypothetical protein VCH24_00990 [Variovorax boronicumulans]